MTVYSAFALGVMYMLIGYLLSALLGYESGESTKIFTALIWPILIIGGVLVGVYMMLYKLGEWTVKGMKNILKN